MTFKNILCVTDLSDVSKNAEQAAVNMAQYCQANLTILSCGEDYFQIPINYFENSIIQPMSKSSEDDDYNKHLLQKKIQTTNRFKEIQDNLNINLQDKINFEIKLDDEVSATIDFIDQNKKKFDLIIVGKQINSHWERILFGSPAKEICDETKISTLIIPMGKEWENWKPAEVVVCKGLLEDKNLSSILMGVEICRLFASKLKILHIIDENNQQFANNFTHIFPMDYIPSQNGTQTLEEEKMAAQGLLDNMIKEVQKTTLFQEIDSAIQTGRVGDKVVEYLSANSNNNLLIIGSKGENALKRFLLGNNTDALEEACPVPVLIAFDFHIQ